MRIIIAGAGDVGFHLAKLLANEDLDITLIDTDPEKLKYAANHLDVATVKGTSTSPVVLLEAQVANADLLISATSFEEVNLATAVVAKRLGARKTIARISNFEFLLFRDKIDLKALGIDEIISPESLAAREIKRLLREAALTDSFDFDGGKLSLVGITIDANSPLAGLAMSETRSLNPDSNFITVAILRGHKTIIPKGNTKFEVNDHAYFIAQPEGIDRLLNLAGKKRIEIRNIMILGGSKIGYNAARQLSKRFNVKLIELDKDKSFELADMLPKALIINGDGRDVELLEEEGLSEMDAFIAVTGDSETNIISCLVAKDHGVNKTIALVENTNYIHLSQNIGVDTMINKKLIAANFIFRYIRKGEIISLTGIHGVDAEIMEFVVKHHSSITAKRIKDLNFPKSAIIGGVIRRGIGVVAMGDFVFEPLDRVVVLCLPECIRAVEEYFK